MIKWEYKVVETTYRNYDNIVEGLNEEGEQGWELINERVNSREGVTAYTFKRRKRIETRWPMRFDDGGFLEKVQDEGEMFFYLYVPGREPIQLHATEEQAANGAQAYPDWLVFMSEELL